ncbi:hypothetical protein S40293_05986 [Stachybotrys chartarum IBT 40293]|nr:hypothetical protein S40293_05986 [Stachybotrys chartarum IBT 40293]
MGGIAFTGKPWKLYTPRMQRDEYKAMKEHFHYLLREIYYIVASPIEGPGKTDYGDLDILVALPKENNMQHGSGLRRIFRAINAKFMITEPTYMLAANYAVPWPGDEPQTPDDGGEPDGSATPTEGKPENEDEKEKIIEDEKQQQLDKGKGKAVETDSVFELDKGKGKAMETDSETEIQKQETPKPKPRFVQVDVEMCPSLERLQWMLFKFGHGDFWGILNPIIRPYGFIVEDGSLWVRIHAIEKMDKQRSKIMLSSEPAKVLGFFGLPIDGFWDEPFQSLEELYEYIAHCRLFWVGQVYPCKSTDPLELTTRERQKIQYRLVFRRWIEEFRPMCREDGRFIEEPYTRAEITELALDYFSVREEFDQRFWNFVRENKRNYIWDLAIQGSIPEPDGQDADAVLYRSLLHKNLRKVIIDGSKSFKVTFKPDSTPGRGYYDTTAVKEFIEQNIEVIGHVGFARHQKQTERDKEARELAKCQADFDIVSNWRPW